MAPKRGLNGAMKDPSRGSNETGAWEKHTKGFGAKMLAKMGWAAGKGLGKDEEGIAAPLEARVRPTGMGIGFRGFNEKSDTSRSKGRRPADEDDDEMARGFRSSRKSTKKKGYESEADSDEDADADRAAFGPSFVGASREDAMSIDSDESDAEPAWKKQADKEDSQRRRRHRREATYIRTAEEIMEDEADAPQVAGEKDAFRIIDMTGREAKILDSGSALQTASAMLSTAGTGSVGDVYGGHLLEFRHNIRQLYDASVAALQHASRTQKVTAAFVETQERQRMQLKATIAAHVLHEEHVEAVLAIFTSAQTMLDELAASFKETGEDELLKLAYIRLKEPLSTLQTKYIDVYRERHLDAGLVSLLSPLIKHVLSTWRPFQHPEFAVDFFYEWRALLESKQNDNDAARKMTAYETLMFTVWLPPVQQAFLHEWQLEQYDGPIRLLQAWQFVLPDFIYHHLLLSQQVVPKLRAAIEHSSSASSSLMALHTWFHPWLPLLGDQLDALTPLLHARLARDIGSMSIRDPSLLSSIDKWRSIFNDADFEQFMARHIVPKLTVLLRDEFAINPKDQDLEPLKILLSWRSYLPRKTLTALLGPYFFHRWLHVMYLWLRIEPKGAGFFDQVSAWYKESKGWFPDDVLKKTVAKESFQKALEMMNFSLAGDRQRLEQFEGGLYTKSEAPSSSQRAVQQQQHLQRQEKAAAQQASISFRETLEYFAGEHNISFRPIPGRTHPLTGKPLFHFGPVTLYLDNHVVWVPGENEASLGWQPVSFDELLTRAKQ